MKIGVLLSGCGVYDGAEIHEAVLTLLALDKLNAEAICLAPDIPQHHVVNHLDGSEINESRNVLVEAARIARGNIKPLGNISAVELDGLAIAGGFGVAKNLTKWAFSGPDGEIESSVKNLIVDMVKSKKPLAAMCMAPTTVAKALEGSGIQAKLTVGTTEATSPYDIAAISQGMESVGGEPVMSDAEEVVVDEDNKIITTPCYMMEASIAQIYTGIKKACAILVEMATL
jgi:enhancing lycopene biosynthesis protein 2